MNGAHRVSRRRSAMTVERSGGVGGGRCVWLGTLGSRRRTFVSFAPMPSWGNGEEFLDHPAVEMVVKFIVGNPRAEI